LTFPIFFDIFPKNVYSFNYEKKTVHQSEARQEDHSSAKTMGCSAEKEDWERPGSMKGEKIFLILPALLVVLAALACSTKPKTSILLRDPLAPYKVIEETFAKEGKSDYILMNDEGYSFRLIYLCENRIYNFAEEPRGNPVLVSLQPILDTSVEKKLRADDRRRIWACMERKAREEQSRVEELKRRVTEEKIRLEKEVRLAWAERDQIAGEIEKKKKLEAQKARRAEEEMRRAEEERLRKLEEEQRRKAEEERKIKVYRGAEKEELSSLPPQVTESGIFFVMKESDVHEEGRETSKIQAKAKKYDIFDVLNSKKDENGVEWYQIILSERVISEKGKKFGWSPEERSFWVKNKLLAWVYPGDPAKIQTVKPLKINAEEIQFTGKKATTAQKATLYEVVYEVNAEITEKILGWVDEKSGIRRSNKNKEEMRNLLQELSKTSWPLQIQNDILGGYIRIGFTPEQVVLSWGRPDHINTTKTLVGVHEQWVYGENPFPNSYVYFENGLVNSWEFLKKSGK
jgi:ribosomal protein L13